MKDSAELDEMDERSRPKPVSELVRKALVSGVGALFMTEEGIRSVVKELKLPKDALASALAQAEKTKADVVRIVGQEVNAFLRSAQVREEMLKVLSELRLEIRAEVSFKPKGGAKENEEEDPELDASIRLRREPARKGPKKKAPASDEG